MAISCFSLERLARAQNGELNSTAFAWGNPRQDFQPGLLSSQPSVLPQLIGGMSEAHELPER